MEHIVAVEASALERVLKVSSGLIGRGSVTMPVLEHAWLRREVEVQRSLSSAGGDPQQRLVVTTTNQEAGADLLIENADFRVWPAGSEGLLLPIERALAWLSTIARGEIVAIRTEGAAVELSCAGDQIALSTLPAEDFPRPRLEENRTAWTLSVGVLATVFGGVEYALPTRDHRRALTGVFVELTAGGPCRLTATDGKVLCRVSTRDGEVMGPFAAAAIPPAFFRAVSSAGGASVALSIGERQAHAVLECGTIWCSTIEGKYPSVDAVIPRTLPRSVSIDSAALVRAVTRSRVVCDDKTKAVLLRQDGETLIVTSMSADRGEADSLVRGVRDVDGAIVEFAVNAALLLDTLKALGAQRVILRQVDEVKPMLWEAEGPEGGHSWLHLLMPIKMSEVAGAKSGGE